MRAWSGLTHTVWRQISDFARSLATDGPVEPRSLKNVGFSRMTKRAASRVAPKERPVPKTHPRNQRAVDSSKRDTLPAGSRRSASRRQKDARLGNGPASRAHGHPLSRDVDCSSVPAGRLPWLNTDPPPRRPPRPYSRHAPRPATHEASPPAVPRHPLTGRLESCPSPHTFRRPKILSKARVALGVICRPDPLACVPDAENACDWGWVTHRGRPGESTGMTPSSKGGRLSPTDGARQRR